MTNEPPPAVQGPRPPGVPPRHEMIGANFLLLGCLLGLLRGSWIVAVGAGGVAPWIEAAYAAVLHLTAGYAASVVVRGLFDRPSLSAPAGPPPMVAAEVVPATMPDEVPESPTGPPPLDAARWRELIDAAREANDPARVLELRESAPGGLDPLGLKDLDADLGRWFLGLVHRRLRSGPLQMELVTLTDRVSETLGHTKEGASLRAALPTLRRGAGLCPRCAKPYAGVWEACPECMGRPEPPPPAIPGLDSIEAEAAEDEPPPVDGRWFIDPDDGASVDGRAGS